MIEVKTAILDDETTDLKQVKDYFDQVSSDQLKYCCDCYTKIEASFYAEHDLYIIDIEMPTANGLDIARELREKYPHAVVILNSKRNDLVFESFKFGVFFFVRKDHFEEDMSFAQIRLNEHFSSSKKTYRYHTKDKIQDILFQDIMYIEKMGHYIEIHLSNGQILIDTIPMRNIIHEFNDPSFIQCHQSYLVNLAYVQCLDEHDFMMENHDKVQISKRLFSKVKQSYIYYLNKKVTL